MSAVTKKIMRSPVRLTLATMVAIGMCCVMCRVEGSMQDKTSANPIQIVLDWSRFVLRAEINTEGYRGPVAARTYAYISVAAYEAALPGIQDEYQSMAGVLKGLQVPELQDVTSYDLPVALNACYGRMVHFFFMSAPENLRASQVQLEKEWNDRLRNGMDSVRFRQSVLFGQTVADSVIAWSARDSLGNRANHHNYDRNYFPPVGDGLWVTSPDFPMPPLLPYWGDVRPFIINTDHFIARPLPAYTSDVNQVFHKQALEIVALSKPLSVENQWIAEFWNDDRPGLTFTPAGHWMEITNQVLEAEQPRIGKVLETHLRVSIGLCDAMIACFASKYLYNFERPETYIRKHIDPSWHPFSPSPSFPSYPSGHSMMGSAAAEILTAMYGSTYSMTDRSHEGLKDFKVKPRSFDSFDAMSRENALSRVFLGVHWRFDCEEGLRLGEEIGHRVMQLNLHAPVRG